MTTWDVRTPAGEEVTDLAGLARALRTDPTTAAKHLLANEEAAGSAPPALLAEVKTAARPKPGGGTPPPISTGNFVSWSGGKGRVDLLVTSGKVPGVSGDVEGTTEAPAARVVVWKDGKATDEKIAASTHTLRRIPPLDKPTKDALDPVAALVTTVADHDARCEALSAPDYRRVTGVAVKSAYDRGIDAWPGADRTTLTPEQWGLGRAEFLVKVAAGVVDVAGNDADLLHPDHPLARDSVMVDMSEVNRQIADILADAT